MPKLINLLKPSAFKVVTTLILWAFFWAISQFLMILTLNSPPYTENTISFSVLSFIKFLLPLLSYLLSAYLVFLTEKVTSKHLEAKDLKNFRSTFLNSIGLFIPIVSILLLISFLGSFGGGKLTEFYVYLGYSAILFVPSIIFLISSIFLYYKNKKSDIPQKKNIVLCLIHFFAPIIIELIFLCTSTILYLIAWGDL